MSLFVIREKNTGSFYNAVVSGSSFSANIEEAFLSKTEKNATIVLNRIKRNAKHLPWIVDDKIYSTFDRVADLLRDSGVDRVEDLPKDYQESAKTFSEYIRLTPDLEIVQVKLSMVA